MVHFDGCLLGDVDGVLIRRRKGCDVSLVALGLLYTQATSAGGFIQRIRWRHIFG